MNEQRILHAALDCISRFKTSKYPLKNAANHLILSRKLNSSERKLLLNIVFAWARESYVIADFLSKELRFFASMSEQDKDRLASEMLGFRIAHFNANDQIIYLAERYEAYLNQLGDKRYLIALGEVIKRELVNSFGDQALIIAKGLSEPPKKWLAFDKTKIQKEELINELKKLGYDVFPHAIAKDALGISKDLNLNMLPMTLRDQVWFMDAGSQIIASLIRPLPHQRVLDMCAGEGGKARFITMNPCSYVALDIDGNRLKRAKSRLKGKSVQFIEADATKVSFKEKFDWILLDAPCSGSGVLRRHPDLIYRLHQKDLDHYHQLQLALLTKAISLLSSGAHLIYATCSLFASENKQQIDRLLALNKNLIVQNLDKVLIDGQIELSTTALNNNSLQLIPHIHDTDGFFAVSITKSAE